MRQSRSSAVEKPEKAWPRRPLTDAQRSQLWGESYRLCNNPNCRKECVIPAEGGSAPTLVGEHAHIVAHSDAGPRGDPGMSQEQRDSLDNIILLCRFCHKFVDQKANEEVYSKSKLREWKQSHQMWLKVTIPAGLERVSPAEIKVVCEAIMGVGKIEEPNFSLTDVAPKIGKNGLTDAVRNQIRMGLAIADRVQGVLTALGNVNPAIPEKTREGFAVKYFELRERYAGDALFYRLWAFAMGEPAPGLDRQQAALAVLAYFFHACDVFEP